MMSSCIPLLGSMLCTHCVMTLHSTSVCMRPVRGAPQEMVMLSDAALRFSIMPWSYACMQTSLLHTCDLHTVWCLEVCDVALALHANARR
jgi:hypothetical protein